MNLTIQFMIQALQNSDARLTFGIEALKQCYQQLGDLPDYLKEIYTNFSDKIREYDPVFLAKFVQFYNQTNQNAAKAIKQPENKKLGERQDLFSSFSEGDYETSLDPKKQVVKGQDRGDSSLKTNARPELRQPGATNQKPQPPIKNNVPLIPNNDKRKSPDQASLTKPPPRSEEMRLA